MEQTKKITKRAVIQTNLYDWVIQNSWTASCISYWVFCIGVSFWFIWYLADKEIIVDGTNIVDQYINGFKMCNYINGASIGLFLLVINHLPNQVAKGINSKLDEPIGILFLMANIIAKEYYWVTHTEFLMDIEKTRVLSPSQKNLHAQLFFSNLFTYIGAMISTGLFAIVLVVLVFEALKYPCVIFANLIKTGLRAIKFNYVKETVVDIKQDV